MINFFDLLNAITKRRQKRYLCITNVCIADMVLLLPLRTLLTYQPLTPECMSFSTLHKYNKMKVYHQHYLEETFHPLQSPTLPPLQKKKKNKTNKKMRKAAQRRLWIIGPLSLKKICWLGCECNRSKSFIWTKMCSIYRFILMQITGTRFEKWLQGNSPLTYLHLRCYYLHLSIFI